MKRTCKCGATIQAINRSGLCGSCYFEYRKQNLKTKISEREIEELKREYTLTKNQKSAISRILRDASN